MISVLPLTGFTEQPEHTHAPSIVTISSLGVRITARSRGEAFGSTVLGLFEAATSGDPMTLYSRAMTVFFTGRWRWLALAAAVAVSAGAPAALAASPHTVGLVTERPLHERLAQADAAAIGTVAESDLGRIRVRDAVGLVGQVAADFELKRAPSRPPGLEPGDRVLLLLRGQRSPYLLVDRAAEIQRVDDADGVAAWREGLGALRSSDGPPVRIAVYAGWLGRAPPDLRRAALLGLGAEPSLPPAIARRLARDATDPSVAPDLRLLAARAAGRSEQGSRELLSRLPGSSEADPEVLAAAFSSPFHRADDARSAALRRALAHPRADVRIVGLRYGTHGSLAPDARTAIERLANDDPDPNVRTAAQRVLR
jgi:hypothetical protein